MTFYSTMCCKTTRTMLRASRSAGRVFCSAVMEANDPKGKKASKQASKQASTSNTQQPHTQPKGNPRTGRRQTQQPAAAGGTKATPTPPHHPKPNKKASMQKLKCHPPATQSTHRRTDRNWGVSMSGLPCKEPNSAEP